MNNEHEGNGYDFFAAIKKLVTEEGWKAEFHICTNGSVRLYCPKGKRHTPTKALHWLSENGDRRAASILEDLSPKILELIRQTSDSFCCKSTEPEDKKAFRYTRNKLLTACGLSERYYIPRLRL